MGRIRPMASVLRAWWPVERGALACLLPRPSTEAARSTRSSPRSRRCGLARLRAGRRGAHRVRGHRARGPRGGAASSDSPVDGKRQGLRLEHHHYAADVPDKEIGGGAHPSSGAVRRRRRSLGATAFDSGGGCTVVTDGRGVPLQLGGGGQ
jgi:hypothetical protein